MSDEEQRAKPAKRGARRDSVLRLDIMKRAGLVPEDTAFNRRAAEYAKGAVALAAADRWRAKQKGQA